MPITTSPRSRYFFWSSSKPGISLRHGAHQVAQKSTSATLPRSSSEENSRPAISVSLKAGMRPGAAAGGPPPRHEARTVRATRTRRLASTTLPLAQDRDLSGQQAYFYFGDAIQASEVLLHPIGSEVSGHPLDAQVDALDRGI